MNVEALFQPIRIAGLELPNRFIMPAMQRGFATEGVPGPDMADYYKRRIECGVGLVIGEGTAVNHPSATGYDDFARLTPAAVDGWKRVLESVKEVEGHMFLQLWHQGGVRPEGVGPFPEAQTLSPSGLALPGQPNGRAMIRKDLDEILAAYVEGAKLAVEIGFDGVEIHSAHGYMLDQFLWSGTNKRNDEYGGSMENRCRFPCDIIRAVRAATAADFPISVRLSQWKTRAYDAKNVEHPEAWSELIGHFERAGADMLHVSTRCFWTPEFHGSPLGLAGWTKRFTNLPVVTVGSVGLDTDIMSSFEGVEARSSTQRGIGELLARFENGEFDLVAVGRAILSDPEWVQKVRDDRYDDLRSFTPDTLAYLE